MPSGTPQQGDIETSTAREETHSDDRGLYDKICEVLGSSLPLDGSSTLAVVLYSDTFCPILKHHSQLISELATAIPTLLQKSIDREHLTRPTQADKALSPDTLTSSTSEDISSNILAMILSPKSDIFIRGTLAVPFQLDLFDRMRLARIQIAESFSHLEIPLLLDDSFGQMQDRNRSPFDKSQPNQSIQWETKRLQTILARVATTAGALELVTVLEQSQTDLYGMPVDLPGKVVYVVTRHTLDKSRVKVASSVRWVDRVFLKAGYTSEWIAANLLTVFARIDTEGVNEREEAGEDWVSEDNGSEDEDEHEGGAKIRESLGTQECEQYLEEVIYLSDLRPEEAKVRVMVKQNRGESVLEPGVLAQVQRSKLFEMQAIRKPRFSQMMGALSLGGSTGHRSHHPHRGHFNTITHSSCSSNHSSRSHAPANVPNSCNSSSPSSPSNGSNPFL
ncbi:hypothetical protein BGZ59_008790 [Podila verticillata]|nr:hypothetical protein BGZ59_008790 [Podila verticillata]